MVHFLRGSTTSSGSTNTRSDAHLSPSRIRSAVSNAVGSYASTSPRATSAGSQWIKRTSDDLSTVLLHFHALLDLLRSKRQALDTVPVITIVITIVIKKERSHTVLHNSLNFQKHCFDDQVHLIIRIHLVVTVLFFLVPSIVTDISAGDG